MNDHTTVSDSRWPAVRPGRKAALVAAAAALLLAACAPAAPGAPGNVPRGTPDGAASGATAIPAVSTAVSAAVTALPAVAEGWTTYTDATLGYSLSFPDDVDFTCGTSQAGIYTARLQFRVPGTAGYQGMVLRVEPNGEGQDVEQLAADFYRRKLLEEPPPDFLQQLGRVSVAGLPGVQMGAGGDFSLIVPYGDRVYILAPVHAVTATALDPQALALFYQVLSTLRLGP